jgi:hypothetical protein
MVYMKKKKGNKTFSIFNPSSAISGKIWPNFCHGFVWRFNIFTRPLLSCAAEKSAGWEHCYAKIGVLASLAGGGRHDLYCDGSLSQRAYIPNCSLLIP